MPPDREELTLKTRRAGASMCNLRRGFNRAKSDRARIRPAVIIERDDFVASQLRSPEKRRVPIAHAEKRVIGKPIYFRHVRFSLGAQTQGTFRAGAFA